MKYKITVRINGKQVDSAYAKTIKTANWIVRTILSHGLGVYDIKRIERVSITIKEVTK